VARTKKITVLFSPELHERLSRLAENRRASLEDLVRRACELQYGFLSSEARLDAVRELAGLSLPLADSSVLEQESVPAAGDLLPP
jgi:hypothetical protein